MKQPNNGRSVWAVALVMALAVMASVGACFVLPIEQRKAFLVIGTLDQVVGVFLVAWPDLANTAKQGWKSVVLDVRRAWDNTKAMTRLAIGTLKARLHHVRQVVQNRIRKWRGLGQHYTYTPGPASLVFGGSAPTAFVKGTGDIEARLARLENLVGHFPGQWQADMSNLRDDRIAFRWYGVPLILVGLVLVLIGSW